jgi:hypothetical protein
MSDGIALRDATVLRLEAQLLEERRQRDVERDEWQLQRATLVDRIAALQRENAEALAAARREVEADVERLREVHSRAQDAMRTQHADQIETLDRTMRADLDAARADFAATLQRSAEEQRAALDVSAPASGSDPKATVGGRVRAALHEAWTALLTSERGDLLAALQAEHATQLHSAKDELSRFIMQMITDRAAPELRRAMDAAARAALEGAFEARGGGGGSSGGAPVELPRDALNALCDEVAAAANGTVSGRFEALKADIERMLAEGDARLRELGARLAASSVVRWSSLPNGGPADAHSNTSGGGSGTGDANAAFSRYAALMRRLLDDGRRMSDALREGEEVHARNMDALESQLGMLRRELESERSHERLVSV